MFFSQAFLSHWRVFILLFFSSSVWAQQDTADRLWQGTEQQLQQLRQQATPSAPQQEGAYENALKALTQTPRTRLQELTFAILEGINQRDWFGVDVLLRQYVQIPQHDPTLGDFVAASRMAAEGDYDRAIAAYRAVLQTNPQFVRGELDLARVLFADQRLGDAQQAFERLRSQPLPPGILQHIDEYLGALKQRRQARFSLSVSAVREDNVNGASTVVDPCALVFLGACLPNTPGQKRAASGVYVEATLNKLWPLAGNHGLMLRSINYGNHYRHESDYGNLVSTNYFGYQYASARQQWQVLPLFEYDREGGQKIYHAFGVRASLTRQLTERAQVEASYEFKTRHFAPLFAENLEGHFRSFSLFGTYALKPDLAAYGSLSWRATDARMPVFAYREKVARLGIYKSFGNQATLNAAYGYRQKQADATNAVFGRRQRDHEGSIYLNVSLPGYQWQGLIPTATYEFRDNRSSIAHAYNYEKHRFTLGVRKEF